MVFKLAEETGVPGENPRCQVGTINPTDMPDGSGQQLTVATIVPRPSIGKPSGQLDNPSSEWGRPRGLALGRSPIQVLTGPDVA